MTSVGLAELPHVVEERRQGRVGRGDLAVVGLRRVLRIERRGGWYGACGSNTCTHTNHGLAPFWFFSAPPILPSSHSRASATTAAAGRSGMAVKASIPDPSPKRSSYTSNPAFSPNRECSGNAPMNAAVA